MASRYFIGGSGDWTDTAHWSATDGGAGGETAPTSADDVYLTASSSGTLTVNSASNAKTLICTGFTGGLTQGANLTVSGNITFVSGMTYTPSTYTLKVNATCTIVSAGKGFYHFAMEATGGATITVTMSDNGTVNGNYTTTTGGYAVQNTINGNNLYLKGDCTCTEGRVGGTTVFYFNGSSGATQTITSSNENYYGFCVPITINITGGGTFAMTGQWQKGAGDFTHIAGTVTYGTSTVNFKATFNLNTNSGALQFYNLTCSGDYPSPFTVTTTGDITVNNTFKNQYRFFSISGAYNLICKGDVDFGTTTEGCEFAGSTSIVIQGSGNATFTGNAGSPINKNITINRSANTLTLAGTIVYNGSGITWTHTAGTVSAGTSIVRFSGGAGSGQTINVVPNTMSFYKVELWGGYAGSGLLTLAVTGTMTVTNTLYQYFRGTVINTGTINVAGLDMSTADGWTISGSASLVFNGTGTWQGTTGYPYANSLELNTTINTAGTLTVAGRVNFKTGTLTYTAGTMSVGTSVLCINATCTLNTNGVSWYDILFNATNTTTLSSLLTYTNTLQISTGNTTLAGTGGISGKNVTIDTSKTFSPGGNTITLTGNWTKNGTFTAGTSTVVFNGTSTVAGATAFYSLTINSTKTVHLTSGQTFSTNASGTFTANGCTLDAVTASSSATLTVSGAQNVGTVVATDIDSSAGNQVINIGGTHLRTTNWSLTGDKTVNASVLNVVSAVQTPSLVLGATQSPSVLVVTPSVQEPVVAIGPVINPSVFVVTPSVQAPAVEYGCTISPSVLVVTPSVQAPVVSISTTNTVTTLDIASSVQTPTPLVSYDATVLDVSVGLQTPTVIAVAEISISPSVLTFASSVVAPSVTVTSTTSVSISPAVLTIVTDVSGSVASIPCSVTVSAIDLVSSIPTPSMSNVFTASVISFASSVVDPTVQYGVTLYPDALQSEFWQPIIHVQSVVPNRARGAMLALF